MESIVYTVRMVKVYQDVGGIASLIAIHRTEAIAVAKAKELNETEQSRTPGSPYQFIVDPFRLQE